MTEKIKDRMFSWMMGLLFVLLGWIAGGVGWLVVRGADKDVEQDGRITENTNGVGKVARVQCNDPDTDAEEKEELRPLYFNTRSGE